jgi:hypothetical protein
MVAFGLIRVCDCKGTDRPIECVTRSHVATDRLRFRELIGPRPETSAVLEFPSVAVGPRGESQISVVCQTSGGHFDLRLFSSEEFIVPSWWIGISDQDGDLLRTEISHGADLSPRDLFQWLNPIVGSDAAGQLVRLAVAALPKARRSGQRKMTAGR